MYSQDSDGIYRRQVAGDIYPFNQRSYLHRNLVFPLELPAAEHAIYIKVVS